jgi:hypothetical protein
MTVANAELFRTATGQRLHIAECPHVLGAVLFPVTAEDLDAREVCRWCAAELSDEGRTYHETIESALIDMGAAQHAVPELASYLRTVEHDARFVPYSRSYVALALGGRTVAWAGVTYVGFRDGRKILLPGYVPGTGAGGHVSDRWGERCAVCNMKCSMNGTCFCF